MEAEPMIVFSEPPSKKRLISPKPNQGIISSQLVEDVVVALAFPG
jgi:hypothetical protein